MTTPTTPGRRLTRLITSVLAVGLAAGLLAGCTSAEPEPKGRGSDGAATEGSSREADGPTPQELSEELLDAGRSPLQAPAVATGGGTFPNSNVELQVEVVSLERTDTGTVLTARFTGRNPLSAAEMRYKQNWTFDFARAMFLVDDAVTASRYLPLQFSDGRPACVCPGLPIALGDEPQMVHATYPLLPDNVSTVDLVFNDAITIPDVPVSG